MYHITACNMMDGMMIMKELFRMNIYIYRSVHVISVRIPYAEMALINVHADVSSKAREV